MEGDRVPTDYAAVLADMEAKYAALGNAIASLRTVLATGILGPISEFYAAVPGVSSPSISSSLPRGAFLGKSVSEAIKLFLSAMRKKQTNKEIAQALKDGGLESAGNFDNYVTGGLFRLKNEGVLLRFDDGWGLAEWYPESFRARVIEKTGTTKRKASKKTARKVRKATEPEPKSAPTKANPVSAVSLDQRVEAVLRGEPQRVFLLNEIADAVDATPQTVTLALARMARSHKSEKAQNGYRAFSGNVQAMPKVG